MNRRSFLKFAGLVPIVPIIVKAAEEPKMFVHTFNWNDDLVDVLTKKDGVWSFWIKKQGEEKFERLVVNDMEVEIANQGGTGLVLSADPIIRIDHECNCRNIPIPKPRTRSSNTQIR